MKLGSYIACLFVSPLALVPLTFGTLCAIECSALPWLTLFVAPALLVIFWLGLTIHFFRATRTLEKVQRASDRMAAIVFLFVALLPIAYFAYPTLASRVG